MTTKVDAIFERGVFRPTEPVELPDGTRVALTIDSGTPAQSARASFQAISEIAALPLESPADGFSGADHDRVLYGTKRPK